jgi:hypothetical protein
LKSFLKTDGYFSHGKWFCSENHSKNDPEIIKIEEMQAKLKARISEAEDVGDDDEDDEGEVEYEI